MRLVMHIETDDGEGLTDPARLAVPDLGDGPLERQDVLDGISDFGMQVMRHLFGMIREARGK